MRCDVFLVRVINLYIPSSIAIHGTRALAAFGSLATTYHGPPVVSGGSFFQDRIFAVAVPIRLLQMLQLFLDESTCVEWAGLAGDWPRPHPERADPWEPRPIRVDNDVSYDQGPTPLREVYKPRQFFGGRSFSSLGVVRSVLGGRSWLENEGVPAAWLRSRLAPTARLLVPAHSSSSMDLNSTRAAVDLTARLLAGAAPWRIPVPETQVLERTATSAHLPPWLQKSFAFNWVLFCPSVSECVAPV